MGSFKCTGLVEEALAKPVSWNFCITLVIRRSSRGVDFRSIFSMALMAAFWEFSFWIKITPDWLLYKNRKIYKNWSCCWASGTTGWPAPPTSHFIYGSSKSSLQVKFLHRKFYKTPKTKYFIFSRENSCIMPSKCSTLSFFTVSSYPAKSI